MTVALIQFRNISRPLRELTMAAEKLGAGELSARANVKGEDEASRVALVFNRMATDLQLTQQRLREQVDALSKLDKIAGSKCQYQQPACLYDGNREVG